MGDYAVIGDCRSAALIARDGSLEWLCWPRFDSPAYLAAMLDRDRGGHCSIHPTTPHTATRRYLTNTNVLETTFHTSSGTLVLTDLMPVDSEESKRQRLWPQREVVRRLDCQNGVVQVEITCSPRPNYARDAVRLRDRGPFGIHCHHKNGVLIVRSDVPLTLTPDQTAIRGDISLRAGERRYVSITHCDSEPAVLPHLATTMEPRIAATESWWRSWAARCSYEGDYKDAVVRSALTLKLMTFAPSGAVIAAPTTSLPERIGGTRNWDYRYCWLRDASLTLQSLFDLGYTTEAAAFLSWLIHTTRITRPELHPFYDVYGLRDGSERELDHLAGFAGSRPVRIGNGAASQLQLDVYGEVIDAAYSYVARAGHLDRAAARMLVDFGKFVCRRWRDPDAGIWEIRSGPRQHTYSKAMCWVALDRLLELHRLGELRAPVHRFSAERAAIQREIEAHGFNAAMDSYVNVLAGDAVDASLLQLSRRGYVDGRSPRMLGTVRAVQRALGRNGLIYRYRTADGLPAGEGAFGIASFWAVGALALAGQIDEGTAVFEHLLTLGNDVGLFAEEIDPDSGEALGNFPQTFTHVGLIDAALTLSQCRQPNRPGVPQPASA